jgi:hypothetical protein
MWELWIAVGLAAVLVYFMLRAREGFIIKYGNPMDGEDLVSFDRGAKGTRLAATTPDTCPADKSDLQSGLCYEQCANEYSGEGPVCWADTANIGVGRAVGLEPCPDGWINDGLICREPLRWESCRWRVPVINVCIPFLAGGALKGRLDGGGICDWPQNRGALPEWLIEKRGSDVKNWAATHPNKIAGLCYKDCPKNKPDRVPGMPYLCFRRRDENTGVSYGRGVGTVPPLFVFGA